jgi:RNA-binding protein NOB1
VDPLLDHSTARRPFYILIFLSVVTEFSKKTGDYPSLSATDIQVLALTYELEKQLVGNEHLKTEPTIIRTQTVGKSSGIKNLAGFYMPKKVRPLFYFYVRGCKP